MEKQQRLQKTGLDPITIQTHANNSYSLNRFTFFSATQNSYHYISSHLHFPGHLWRLVLIEQSWTEELTVLQKCPPTERTWCRTYSSFNNQGFKCGGKRHCIYWCVSHQFLPIGNKMLISWIDSVCWIKIKRLRCPRFSCCQTFLCSLSWVTSLLRKPLALQFSACTHTTHHNQFTCTFPFRRNTVK